jgi:hypothetical protein
VKFAVETREEVGESVVDEDGLPAALLQTIRPLNLADIGADPSRD